MQKPNNNFKTTQHKDVRHISMRCMFYFSRCLRQIIHFWIFYQKGKVTLTQGNMWPQSLSETLLKRNLHRNVKMFLKAFLAVMFRAFFALTSGYILTLKDTAWAEQVEVTVNLWVVLTFDADSSVEETAFVKFQRAAPAQDLVFVDAWAASERANQLEERLVVTDTPWPLSFSIITDWSFTGHAGADRGRNARQHNQRLSQEMGVLEGE